jgi:hypothetical protein
MSVPDSRSHLKTQLAEVISSILLLAAFEDGGDAVDEFLRVRSSVNNDF